MRTALRLHAAARRALAVAAALSVVLAALSARAASFGFKDSGWEGTSELVDLARQRLGQSRVRAVETLDYGRLTPADGVIVLHPVVNLDYDEVSAFLRAGGRLALMDDYGKGAALLDYFHIHRIAAPRHPAQMLRHNPELAIAVPSVEVVAGYEQGRHPIVAHVDKLVTNHPTALVHPNLTPVLTIPAIGEPNATLAVTGIIAGRGRLFAMADPSAVINLMLRYPGNRAFAQGLVDYLVEDDSWGKRGGTLYLVEGQFEQRGHYGGVSSLSENLREYADGLSDLVSDTRRSGLPRSLALVLAGFAALASVLWAALNATRIYHRRLPRYATATALVAQGGVAGRAAVLAAPTTERALALLEVKSALEEGLALRLDLGQEPNRAALLAEIDRQDALSKRSFEDLKQMLDEMNKAELALVAARQFRVKASTVEGAREQMLHWFDEMDERLRRQA
jgi:Domain of unknown function (DUF4350)